ncbi:VWA domain-containing protein [Thalassotalea sp. HSM 43]|uniref:vWA domain-containing protein n=1 Tax=Thalassotalea sp. HSM 43 TaxID=2552945 RepID=UPI00108053F6|nr:VWA domain-containing protein [Thalassotalea sp. HSM 43]QBY06026.1 VWA domain-containing protein [Thalassotalea sp. HSM 43]
MLEFAYPWAFVLLVIPVVIFWLAPAHKERKHSVQIPYFVRLVDVTGETPQTGAVIISRKVLQRIIVALTWLCLVVAMAKPEIIGAPITQEKSARDLMIAVDLSGSMSVEDFTNEQQQTVNRLAAVKRVLQEFVQNREGDRLGLILFGDAPYLQAPFTDDIDTWMTLLNESDIGMAGPSTAFGDAIGLAISVFENSATENRVLIALTDGNDNGSKVPPVDAAKVAAAYNIKIYAIAIGDPSAVGEEKVDMDVINNVADITGGKSYQALNRAELEQVYQQIDELEPQLFDSLSYRPRRSVHFYPIALLAIVYLLSLSVVAFRIKRTQVVNKEVS